MHEAQRVTLHRRPVGARITGESLEELSLSAESEAFERGREQGLRECLETGGAALAKAVEEVALARQRAQDQVAHDSVQLAVEIARQLLKVNVDAGNYDLERIVRSSLADAGIGRGACVVHLHPDDFARLEEVAFRAGTVTECDPNMERGDVHISTPRGLLVRDLDSALLAIREQLFEELV